MSEGVRANAIATIKPSVFGRVVVATAATPACELWNGVDLIYALEGTGPQRFWDSRNN